jgi:aminopeptidase N
MNFRIISLLAISTSIFSCKNQKQVNTTKPVPVGTAIETVQLDTLSVIAKPRPERDIYRASNTRMNDIIHTKLEVNFDWKLSRMNGKATLSVKPYFYETNTLYLNARGMELKSVQVFENEASDIQKRAGNQPLQTRGSALMAASSFVYENDSIKINLGKTFKANETYFVLIDYVSKPNELKSKGSNAISDDKGLYFINPSGENSFKMPQIWTQGETQASSVWFPTIDSPNEKMTQEILMTVDERYTTLSNGTLIKSEKLKDGTRLDHWKLDQPHSPYLAMMAVGEFVKVTDTPWKEKEISYYVEKEYAPFAKDIFGITYEMIDFFSKKLGVEYPWSKYSQIVARDYVSGAMENTSATLHGDFMVYQTPREMVDGKKGESVIAHELFHQWFGDLVTAESWSNLPLNESFATYSDYLWNEYKHGRQIADFHHWESKQGYLRGKNEVDLIRFHYRDKEDMFDRFSYNKGAQVLHMLRKVVGDEAFFASLKKYLETNKYQAAEIHHLRLAFEEVSGRDMNWFFNQWFLNSGRPKLEVNKSYNGTSGILTVTIEQKQDLSKYPLYTLPLEIDIYSGRTPDRKHIVITDEKQSFEFSVPTIPNIVLFDAEKQLLADITYSKSISELQLQYKLSPMFEDRYDALNELSSKLTDASIYSLFKVAAREDSLFAIRNFAIQKLKNSGSDKLDLKSLFFTIYASDKNTSTRAEALSALNELLPSDPEIERLNISALTETSYEICGEALSALAKSNPTLCLQKARLFENESGKAVLFPIANLYATHGGDDQISFFHGGLRFMNGFELMNFCMSYVRTAKRCNNPNNVIMTAKDLESLSKGTSKFMKSGFTKGVKDLLDIWETKEKELQQSLSSNTGNKGALETELKKATLAKNELSLIYNRMK